MSTLTDGEARRTRGMSDNPWFVFVVRRLIGAVLVAVTLVVVTFLILHLIPGDPARRASGLEATQERIDELRETLGLNDPLWRQFVDYLWQVGHLDFGRSFVSNDPVIDVISARLMNTVWLAGVALVLVFVLSLLTGMIAAVLSRSGRHPLLDTAYSSGAGIGSSMPEFLAGTFLVLLFSVWLGWLPVAGSEGWDSVLLPAIAVAVKPASILSRVVRNETLLVLNQDYVRTARSKRLPRWLIYVRHVVPNVLTASLTLGAVLSASLIGGTVIVENLFAWPGLGAAVVGSVLARDYPSVQGLVFVLGMGVVLINIVVDAIVLFVNPKQRMSQ